jgi:trans-2,3-dihydro-3-hydroxyanthranilate isomerase
MMSRRFAVLDVFTDRLFGGNRLAIVEDARGLDAATMQAITREFGFPETIFLLPPEDPANHVKARIFTPGMEIPFAGHPNIGLGVWAASQSALFGRPVGELVRAEEGAGLVALALERGAAGARATLTAPAAFALGRGFAVERAAAAAGLPAAAIATARHAPVYASVGMGFLICELGARDDLAAARCAAEAFDPLEDTDGLHEALYYVRDGARVAMRMFAPVHGIPEDPATGSAAAALVALLAHLDPSPDTELALEITQGDEMGRPSRISAHATKTGGAVGPVRVSGTAVLAMEGTLAV